MGLGCVLLLWGIVGSVLAVVGSLVMWGLAFRLTRGATAGRRRLLVTAATFPFVCLVWAGLVFVFQAVVNAGLLHRDIGIGDGWTCPLPNGYALSFIDVTDVGTLQNPRKRRPNDDGGEHVADGVRMLQLAGPYVLGGLDSQWFEHRIHEGVAKDTYFIVNTKTGVRTDYGTYEKFREAARQLKITPNLVPIYEIYSEYRFTWFEVFAGILLMVPPLGGAVLLLRWMMKLRKTRMKLVESAG